MADQPKVPLEPDTVRLQEISEANAASGPENRVQHQERNTVGGEGSIGVGEGIDDGGTHGGGTATAPTDEELLEERHERTGDTQS